MTTFNWGVLESRSTILDVLGLYSWSGGECSRERESGGCWVTVSYIVIHTVLKTKVQSTAFQYHVEDPRDSGRIEDLVEI